ncbi:MAG: glycosyl transferase [Elusimicrobia bacterium RIFCSPLOWO2_01_FULL_64_13]|nr:MAG: glycosyl transferase [Elusimicrobia bacterium RIFCSPHIGHO2_01_FULL_64_10]OGR94718.1 MAG: glycosyl transferase [Elusimicrobia bacterium RIFCSPLOWO2_01_FULL_64_13]
MPRISVVIPVYNEEGTIEEIVRRVRKTGVPDEILIVDDGSTDSTAALVKKLEGPGVLALSHPRNLGKGAAVRTALGRASGDIILIQDADLEYDPADYPALLAPILDGRADVVYGSRFLGGPHRVLFFWHYAANRLFTLLTNVLYNINLTDMGSCYKAFRADVLRSIPLKADGFGFEPEVTAGVCKRHLRIYETPISYSGRTYAEGKKITWRDGWAYLWTLLRCRF